MSAWRDQIVAHRNGATVMEEPPDRPTIRTLRHALEELSSILTSISERYHCGMACDFYPDRESDTLDADVFLLRLMGIKT